MLPRLTKNTHKTARSKAIAEYLQTENADIIVFQEAFHGGARRIIKSLIGKSYPYEAGPANARLFSIKANSGIWILSKHPIVQQDAITYENKYGIDAFAKKGALLVEITTNGQRIQVVGTHLQNSGKHQLKYKQCEELSQNLLKKHQRSDIPQVICGDFNIEKCSNGYETMLFALGAEDGNLSSEQIFSYDRLTNDLHSEKGTERDLIDYILLRNGKEIVKNITRIIKPIKIQWHKHHQDVSDHYPIISELYLPSINAETRKNKD